METKEQPRPFARAFRRWWWMIAAVVVVAGTVGYVVASGERPVYGAQVDLLVGPVNADADTQAAAGGMAATYTSFVTSTPVLDATSEALGSADDDEYAWGETTARADVTTRILTIGVESDDAELAARIANTLAASLASRVAAATTATETGRLTVIEPAVAASSPIRPRPIRDAALAALAGLGVSLALAIGVEATRMLGRRRRFIPDPADARPGAP